MKRVFTLFMALLLAAGMLMLTSCTGEGGSQGNKPPANAETPPTAPPTAPPAAPSFDTTRPISVVSREDGSGTRSAFTELFGIQSTESDGSKKDNTTREAIIADKTDIMMTNIASDPYAIGYVSLGSLNSTVKAVEVNGVAATADNVKNGSYVVQRPFIIATNGTANGLAKDFIDFIMSAEGQAIVERKGYVAIVANAPVYDGGKPSGHIVIGGSSSVTPLMEVLREEYLKVNPNAGIDIQMNDSSSGMSGTLNGTYDIGMASRELKESEISGGLSPIQIALDGIAVIVNNDNPIGGLTKDQVKDIFTGAITAWSEIQ